MRKEINISIGVSDPQLVPDPYHVPNDNVTPLLNATVTMRTCAPRIYMFVLESAVQEGSSPATLLQATVLSSLLAS